MFSSWWLQQSLVEQECLGSIPALPHCFSFLGNKVVGRMEPETMICQSDNRKKTTPRHLFKPKTNKLSNKKYPVNLKSCFKLELQCNLMSDWRQSARPTQNTNGIEASRGSYQSRSIHVICDSAVSGIDYVCS